MAWTTTKFLAIGSLAAVNVLLSTSGATLTATSGIPGISGAINFIWGAVLTVFSIFLIKEFGTATILGTIYSLLSLPLPLQGLSGFLPKLLIGPLVGLVSDLIYQILKRRERLASVIIGFASQYLTGLSIFLMGLIFNLPGIEKLKNFVLSPLAVFSALLLAGTFGYFGYLLYKKFENSSIVIRIQKGGGK